MEVRLQTGGSLVILEALYGAGEHRVNVAHKLNGLVHNDWLRNVYVGNQLGGDPCPNTPKDMKVTYLHKGAKRTIEVAEGADLTLPAESHPE
jgi:hypothetical protein